MDKLLRWFKGSILVASQDNVGTFTFAWKRFGRFSYWVFDGASGQRLLHGHDDFDVDLLEEVMGRTTEAEVVEQLITKFNPCFGKVHR